MVKTILALMCNPDADPRHSSTAADICASASVVDAKGLFDAINKDGIGSATDKHALESKSCASRRSGCDNKRS